MEAINRTARAMADEVEGLTDKFRLPPHDNDQLLLASARAIDGDAVPFSGAASSLVVLAETDAASGRLRRWLQERPQFLVDISQAGVVLQ